MLIFIVEKNAKCTVLTFNSCTKYVGRPGIVHDQRQIDTLIHKLCGSLMWLAYFWTYCPWVFVQPVTGRPIIGRLVQ